MFSIYIPRIGIGYNEVLIQQAFEANQVGRVRRVDFVALDDAYSSNGMFRKAFVYFSDIYDMNFRTQMIVSTLERAESWTMYPDETNRRVYWILLKNKNPVVDTTLNAHQFAEGHRILKETTAKLDETVEKLEEKNAKLEETVAKLEETAEKQTQQIDYILDLMYELGRDKLKLEETVAKQADEVGRVVGIVYQLLGVVGKKFGGDVNYYSVYIRELLGTDGNENKDEIDEYEMDYDSTTSDDSD